MMYIILAATAFILIACIALLFFTRKPAAKTEGDLTLSPMTSEEIASAMKPSPVNSPLPGDYADYRTSQPPLHDPNSQKYSDNETHRTIWNHSSQEPSSPYNTLPGSANISAYPRAQYELSPSPRKHQSSKNPLAEREQEYERGMQATYDEQLGAIHLVMTNVVMNSPADVSLSFQVCIRKIQKALRQRGLERSALLIDIAGLTIGKDATATWGQSVKTCWDTVCIKVEKGHYLAAHYNSRASRPDREQLQEKVRRVQLMTSAVLNDFQSNIFDSREEAIAFLQRMKELAGNH